MNFQRIGLLGLFLIATVAGTAEAQRRPVGVIVVIETQWVHKNNPRLTTKGRISLYYYYNRGYSTYEAARMRNHINSFLRVWNYRGARVIQQSPLYQ